MKKLRVDTPRFFARKRRRLTHEHSVHVSVSADSDSSITVYPLSLAKRIGVDNDKEASNEYEIVDALGKDMKVVGTCVLF